ncbi:winged helix-turn-helix domain-containing protein [Halonotius roseus]|nr:winged helix-turn-helix domain-containing protein [Halonotius roseus]
MKKPTDSASFSDTESAVLEAALRNPEATNAEIAEETGTRIPAVRDIRNEYEDEVELPDDAAEAGDAVEIDADAADLSDAQLAVLEAAASDPSATNAEIAEETGKRITFVRDTRNEYEDQVDVGVEPETDDADDTAGGSDEVELSDLQQEILDLVAADPTLTNAEVAEETGARVTLVRDTRAEHGDGGFEFGGEPADDGGDATDGADSDSGADGDLQARIQELAEENPEMTYSEIAAEVGARVPLVRDTLADYDYSSGGGIETADDGELPPGVDASMLSDTEQAILELAQDDPELTNAEIAAKTGTHVAIVRDTRAEHEPGKSADYGGQGTIEEDDEDDDDAGTVSASTDDREWDPGEPSDLQTEILRLALENPELTNAEIAAETGARVPVVRDTRADYADLELSELDDDAGEATGESSIDVGPGEPTAVQESILAAAAENPDATNAEIADDLGVRVTLVRDTRRTYEAGDADSASDTDSDAGDEGAAETAAGPEAGVSMGRLVALAALVILIIVVLLSFN